MFPAPKMSNFVIIFSKKSIPAVFIVNINPMAIVRKPCVVVVN